MPNAHLRFPSVPRKRCLQKLYIDSILPNVTISTSGHQFLVSSYGWCGFGVCLRNGVLLDASHCLLQDDIPSNKFNSKLSDKICSVFSCDCILYHKYPLEQNILFSFSQLCPEMHVNYEIYSMFIFDINITRCPGRCICKSCFLTCKHWHSY